MPVEVNWTLGNSGAEIYDVTQEATRVTSGEASNLLNDCEDALWIAGDPPQYVTLRLHSRHPPLRYAGWHAWHDYLTNPRTVELACGSNPHTLVPVLLCRALPGAGTQIWQLPLPIPTADVYVRFTILDTFGAGPTYVNNLVLMANDPGPHYCASRSNSSSSNHVATSVSHSSQMVQNSSNKHSISSNHSANHANDGDDDAATGWTIRKRRATVALSQEGSPEQQTVLSAEDAMASRTARLPSPGHEYHYHNLRLSSSSTTSSSILANNGTRTPAGYVTTSSNPGRGAGVSYGADAEEGNLHAAHEERTDAGGTAAVAPKRSLPVGSIVTPATRAQRNDDAANDSTHSSNTGSSGGAMHSHDNHDHPLCTGRRVEGNNSRNRNSALSYDATANTASAARTEDTTDTSTRMHKLLRELDEDIRMLKPIKPVDPHKNMLVYVPQSVPARLPLCGGEDTNDAGGTNYVAQDSHGHGSAASDGEQYHDSQQKDRRADPAQPQTATRHRSSRHGQQGYRTSAQGRRQQQQQQQSDFSSSDSTSSAYEMRLTKHAWAHSREEDKGRNGRRRGRVAVSPLAHAFNDRIGALEQAMAALTQSIRYQNDDLAMIKRLLFQHAHEERRQRRSAAVAAAPPAAAHSTISSVWDRARRRDGLSVNPMEGTASTSYRAPPGHSMHHREQSIRRLSDSNHNSNTDESDGAQALIRAQGTPIIHTVTAVAPVSSSARAVPTNHHHVSVDFPEAALRAFVESVLQDRLEHQFKHAELRALRHLDAQLAERRKHQKSNKAAAAAARKSSSGRGKKKEAEAAGEEKDKATKQRSHHRTEHAGTETSHQAAPVAPLEDEKDSHSVTHEPSSAAASIEDTLDTHTQSAGNDDEDTLRGSKDDDNDAAVAEVYDKNESRRSDSHRSDSYRQVVTGVFNAVQ